MVDYVPRELAGVAKRALRNLPVVVITGMRQAGKSTMLRRDHRFGEFAYISLDDLATLASFRENPRGILEGPEKAIIDEAQRYREIFTHIKLAVDEVRRPGRFILSGSTNPALLRGVSESMAGRAVYLELAPMNRRELGLAADSRPFLFTFLEKGKAPKSSASPSIRPEEVLKGGLPPVALGEAEDPYIWFTGYEQTYLERDLRDIAAVENILGFRDLLRLAALRTSQILNIANLARDASLEPKTASRYLGWMEAGFIIKRVPPFMRSRTSSIKKSPKLFISDSGLAAFLAGCRDLRESPLRGALFETFVMQNLHSLLACNLPAGRIFYWQTHRGHEVDFVLEVGDEILAVEVKAGEGWSSRDLMGLRAFLEAYPKCRAALLAHNGKKLLRLDERLWAIPLSLLLS